MSLDMIEGTNWIFMFGLTELGQRVYHHQFVNRAIRGIV